MRADVADLAALLGVEVGAVQQQRRLLARLELAGLRRRRCP